MPEQAEAPPQDPPASKRVTDKPFKAETLYALLVAEMAMGRQRHDIALNNYVQQAIETQDAGIAEHATHLARMLRAPQETMLMAEVWSKAEPKSTEARHIYAASLVQAGHFEEAFEQARLLVEAGEAAAFEDLAANAAEGDPEMRAALTEKYKALLLSHPNNSALLVGYSLLLEQQSKPSEALEIARRAIAADKNSISARYQEARLLQVLGDNELAMENMGKLVEANQSNHRLRLRYARALVEIDLSAAHQQYLLLYEQLPFDQDVIFTLGLIERELQIYDAAAERFSTLITRQQHISASNYQLGKIYETQKRPDKALPYYLEVSDGDNYISALIHATRILLTQGKGDEALALVRAHRLRHSAASQERLYVLEADLLTQKGNNRAAEGVLSEGLKQTPNNMTLLYARAMLYTRIDSVKAAEQDLLAIIEQKPDDAAALNALGYTLADRTDRFEEAHSYIERALKITPNDPAVLDSMGWVLYRKGNPEAALIKLRKAMTTMPDHEIAAHLGEVLWVTGRQDEAKAVWRAGLELNPQSKIIHQTINRLNAILD